eukprot:ANDGO_01770.mRNA.1 putative cation-transporting ATPase C1672.11c
MPSEAESAPLLRRSSKPALIQVLQDYEETLAISSVSLLQYSHFRAFFFYLLAVLTCGISLLFARWIPSFSVSGRFRRCDSVSAAQAMFVTGKDASRTIVPIQYGDLRERLTLRAYNEHPDARMFIKYRETVFFWDKTIGAFVQVVSDINYAFEKMHEVFGSSSVLGLTEQKVEIRKSTFGLNSVDVPLKSIPALLIDEVLHPFYVFQLLAIAFWIIDDYIVYACAILVTSAVSIGTTLWETRKNLKKLQDMARFECNVSVLREGVATTVSSNDLVPGDILFLCPPDNSASEEDAGVSEMTLPCDVCLLDGQCVVNESMLTGESTAVVKVALPKASPGASAAKGYNPDIYKPYSLYAGTRLLSSKTFGGRQVGLDKAYGVVVRTGFSTAKGMLVRSILFPKPNEFSFYRDSFRFIGVMGIIAVIGLCISVVAFVHFGVPPEEIFFRSADIITVVVPASLPIALSIATELAIDRLKKHDIFCVSPPRVIVAGKISLFAFDKTGTLTVDSLDLKCFRPVTRDQTGKFRFGTDLLREDFNAVLQANAYYRGATVEHNFFVQEYKSRFGDSMPIDSDEFGYDVQVAPSLLPRHFVEGVASCHGLARLPHVQHLVGDPLETHLFEVIAWKLEEDLNKSVGAVVCPPGIDRSVSVHQTGDCGVDLPFEIGILKRFDFSAELARMSVIVRDLSQSECCVVYVKGSPERIFPLCYPETVPVDAAEILDGYARAGLRVLAMAYKKLHFISINKIERLTREAAETDLRFLGLIVMENKLKEETIPALADLDAACVRCVMVTGDHALTAVSVARKCGIVRHKRRVLLGDLKTGISSEATASWREVEWIDVDDPQKRPLNPISIFPFLSREFQYGTSEKVSIPGDAAFWSCDTTVHWNAKLFTAPLDYSLAVTGKAFHAIASSVQAFEESGVAPQLQGGGGGGGGGGGDAEQYSVSLEYMNARHILQSVLALGSVFARFGPDQKGRLVEYLMKRLNYMVGFCGDGANDSCALTAAHVGLSLSEAEASIAASFTSKKPSIDSVITLMREGRAALVTIFQVFKYMALYSMIQFSTVMLLYSVDSNLSDFEFLYTDLITILPVVVFMGRTGAYEGLVPKRPPAALVSFGVLFSVVSQILLAALTQLGTLLYLREQSWFVPLDPSADGSNFFCYENTVLFLVGNFQYLATAMTFSMSKPYRLSAFTNIPFVVTMATLASSHTLLVLHPPDFARSLLQLKDIPRDFRIQLLFIAAGHMILSYAVEKIFVVSSFQKNLKCCFLGVFACRVCRSSAAIRKKLYKTVISYFADRKPRPTAEKSR